MAGVTCQEEGLAGAEATTMQGAAWGNMKSLSAKQRKRQGTVVSAVGGPPVRLNKWRGLRVLRDAVEQHG